MTDQDNSRQIKPDQDNSRQIITISRYEDINIVQQI